ncbi:MAG TPA: Gfo/Idh/MocA family oxidoreductase [Puia sp.]|nr:Gfo/Idh/MocA family oxidoreductase [Puia sp.]
MTDGKLNFAIIGCGAISQRHAIQAASFGRLTASCDIVGEKAVRLAEKYGATAYSSVEEMLRRENGLDVVAVCTPNGLHASHTIQALKAGCHVVCEKPMAIRTEDTVSMMRAAEEAGRHLFVVKQNRFNPPVALVKRMLDEGRMGRVYSLQMSGIWNRGVEYYKDSWHGSSDMDGGILFTQFSHFIDLLYWMFGDIAEVKAFNGHFADKGNIAFGDTVGVTCRFANGIIGVLHFSINSYRKNMEGSLLIVAEKATVKIGGQYLNTLEYLDSVEEWPGLAGIGVSAPANDYGSYQGSMSNHDKMYQHVAAVICQGSPNQFGGLEAGKTVEIIEKIHRAVV